MVRRSAPASSRCVAKQWRLCLWRHRRHYLPFLTMSSNGGAPADLAENFSSHPANHPDITRHSLLSATDYSGRRGVGRQV